MLFTMKTTFPWNGNSSIAFVLAGSGPAFSATSVRWLLSARVDTFRTRVEVDCRIVANTYGVLQPPLVFEFSILETKE